MAQQTDTQYVIRLLLGEQVSNRTPEDGSSSCFIFHISRAHNCFVLFWCLTLCKELIGIDYVND